MTINNQRTMLEQLVASAAHARLFVEVRSRSHALANFDSWTDVLRMVGSRDSDQAVCDAVLQPLVKAHAKQPDQRLVDVLTVIFWTRLVAVFARARTYDSDRGDLWQNVQLGFLQTLQQAGFGNRGDIMRRVYFGVLRRVHRIYQKTWKQRPRLQQVDNCKLNAARSCRDDRSAVVDFLDEQKTHRDTLATATLHGMIDDIERQLIVATRLDGDTLPAIADRLGLTPDAAKGRRDRAEQQLAATGYRVPNARRLCLI